MSAVEAEVALASLREEEARTSWRTRTAEEEEAVEVARAELLRVMGLAPLVVVEWRTDAGAVVDEALLLTEHSARLKDSEREPARRRRATNPGNCPVDVETAAPRRTLADTGSPSPLSALIQGNR